MQSKFWSKLNFVTSTGDIIRPIVAGQPQAPLVQDQARQVQRVWTAAQLLPDQVGPTALLR